MEWLLGFFLITNIWALWIVSGVFFFIVLAFAENEKNFFAGISVLIFGAIMYHSSYLVLTDPWTIAKYFAMYFAIGATWSVAKWYFYISEKANNFKKHKVEYINRLNSRNEQKLEPSHKTVLPDEVIKNFKEFLIDKTGQRYSYRGSVLLSMESSLTEIVIPQAVNFKEKITTWILWWPTSAFWTILNDPLVKLANAIYDRFQGIYTRISNAVFKDVGL